MLDARRGKGYNENNVTSIIGQGTKVRGEIVTQGTIRIEGGFEGHIQSGDTIVISETGQVKADLVGVQVVISGELHGNCFAHERLEITSTGKVVGDITSPRISIAEGVLFEGKCTMKPPGQVKPPVRQQGGQPAQHAEAKSAN